MAKHTVTVTDNKTGRSIEMPVKEATNGPDAVDIGYRQGRKPVV